MDVKEGHVERTLYKKKLTSDGFKFATPSFKPCFKQLLFCLMDWTYGRKEKGRGLFINTKRLLLL